MQRTKATILVVDDDVAVRRSLERLLSANDYDVHSFSNAIDFISAHAAPPRCALVDLRMPGIDGLEILQLVGRLGFNIPIVLMSGHADVPESVRAMKQGASDFLTKPCSDQLLLQSVREALERDWRSHLERTEHDAVRARFARLTPREKQVFREVVIGKLNKQIAATLGITEKTVKVHRHRVMEKIEVRSLAELVRLATRLTLE